MSRAERRVTISDLAARLGLSQSSVSAALNGGAGVSEATRRRVQELADELGWRPHAGARALRLQRSMAIGLVLSRDPVDLAPEPFYSLVIGGIEQVLQEHDYLLMLRMVGPGGADHMVYQRLSDERSVDGVIVFDAEDGDPRVPLLTSLGLPFVMVGEVMDQEVPQVVSDSRGEAELVVQHLVGLGHRRITHVSGPLALRHERARVDAAVQQARLLGVQLDVVEGDYTLVGAQAAAASFLGRSLRPTAVIGSSDLTALGVAREARLRGLGVPEDLSVMSWDDSILGQLVTPQLSCLSRDPMGIGRAAAQLLVDRLAGGTSAPRTAAPPPRLVSRESTGRPPVTVW